MKILALEFSSEQRSAALCESAADSSRILSTASEMGGRSTRAIALIEKVLAEAGLQRDQIDCIAIGIGPGSYTGIRAGIALAQGWQLATHIKTLGISSVESVAVQSQAKELFGRVNIVIDAQRGEFYLAGYDISERQIRETDKLRLVSADEVRNRMTAGEIVTGPDANVFGGVELFPSAAALVMLAAQSNEFISADKLDPIYLREVNFVKAPPPRIL